MISQAELIKAIQTKSAKELFVLFATLGEESTRPTAEDQIGEVLGKIADAIVEERETRPKSGSALWKNDWVDGNEEIQEDEHES